MDKDEKAFLSAVKRATKEPMPAEKYFSKEVQISGDFVAQWLSEDILGRINILTFNDNEDMLWFDEKDGLWKPGGDILVKKIATEILGEHTTQHYIREVLGYVKAVTYISREKFEDMPKALLPLENGVFNIESMELLPYSPEFYFTSKLRIKYDSKAECPNIMKFVSEVAASEMERQLLLEIAAYCLWRDYHIQKAFMLCGDGGNGKSVYLNLLEALLGRENVASVQLQALGKNRFVGSDLAGKMANICADLPYSALHDPGMFKMLTGGDTIYAERKFRDGFKFRNHAKLIFSANRLPYTEDESSAFYRRWVIINFPFKFEGNGADPHILKKLTAERELSGLFNMAVSVLKGLLRNGLSYDKTPDEIRVEYLRKSNPVGAFTMDCLVESPDDFVPKEALYNAFKEYCISQKMPVFSQMAFTKQLRKFCNVESVQKGMGENRYRAWQGIKLIGLDNDTLNTQATQATHTFPLPKVQQIQTFSLNRQKGVILSSMCVNGFSNIIFLKDFPNTVLGSDEKHYGPFKTGDKAEMPSEQANILIQQGIVSLSATS